MTARNQATAAATPDTPPAAPAEPTEEQLAELQAAIDTAVKERVDEAVAKALEEQAGKAASAAPSADETVSVVEGPLGREFLGKSDFVQIWDEEGNELPPVPKHWGKDELPRGASKKKPADNS